MAKVTYKQKHTSISDIDISLIDKEIIINGWIRNTRIQQTVGFLELHDGSTSKTIQVITEDSAYITIIDSLSIGSAISVLGKVVKHPQKDDQCEIHLIEIKYSSTVDNPKEFILNAKKMSIETLRTNHMDVRVKTRTFTSVFRIRAALSKATHDFFHSIKAHHLNPNIVTTSDCEGGGEVFTISTLLKNKTSEIPICDKTDIIDYSKDFFLKKAYLTVSSQLQLEMLCAGLGKVWTSNKSFRSEKSKTNRHLAEFEHIEWEFAWTNLDQLMDLSEHYTQFCLEYVLTNNMDDLEVLNGFTSKGIIDRLKACISKPYLRITYDDALKIIEENASEIMKIDPKMTLPKWGDDLGSVCEMYIAEKIFKCPTFVYNYPKDLKSFYMKQNNDGRTVQACDLLIPSVGELIGSSVREDDHEKLMKVVTERKMDITPLQWYVDLRKDGSVDTAGAGLGFERLVCICTGMHIRDVVQFIQACGSLKH
jgi:asparaginyl-tRNA synthetase